jgi:hypothetical protein
VIAVKLYSESGSTPDDWELQGLAVPVNLKNVQTNWSVTSQPGNRRPFTSAPFLQIQPARVGRNREQVNEVFSSFHGEGKTSMWPWTMKPLPVKALALRHSALATLRGVRILGSTVTLLLA